MLPLSPYCPHSQHCVPVSCKRLYMFLLVFTFPLQVGIEDRRKTYVNPLLSLKSSFSKKLLQMKSSILTLSQQINEIKDETDCLDAKLKNLILMILQR